MPHTVPYVFHPSILILPNSAHHGVPSIPFIPIDNILLAACYDDGNVLQSSNLPYASLHTFSDVFQRVSLNSSSECGEDLPSISTTSFAVTLE